MKIKNIAAAGLAVILVVISAWYINGQYKIISNDVFDGEKQVWRETKGEKYFQAEFEEFNGVDKRFFEVEKGEMVVVTFRSSIVSGDFIIKLIAPDGEEMKTVDKNQEGRKKFRAKLGGKYYLQVVGQEAKGSFEVRAK